jgi:hypothetical protein
MSESLLISVVIPICNGTRYPAEAVESFLAQTIRPLNSGAQTWWVK